MSPLTAISTLASLPVCELERDASTWNMYLSFITLYICCSQSDDVVTRNELSRSTRQDRLGSRNPIFKTFRMQSSSWLTSWFCFRFLHMFCVRVLEHHTFLVTVFNRFMTRRYFSRQDETTNQIPCIAHHHHPPSRKLTA